MREKTQADVLVPPVSVQFKMQRGVKRSEPPARQLRASAHVATLYAVGSDVTIVTPTVGKDADAQAEWKHAHEVAVATAVDRMPRAQLARPIVAWLEKATTKALIEEGK